MQRPTVEVRFQDLHAEAKVYTDQSRNIPNLLNFFRQGAQVCSYLRAEGCVGLYSMSQA